MAVRKWSCLFIALLMLSVFAGVAAAQDVQGSVESFRVKFKLDTATTKGLYMGEVWVAPAKFTGAQSGRFFTVEARAVGLDSQGSEVDIAAKWESANPAMVKVTPGTGKQVKFRVMKPGQGTAQVSYGNLTRKLDIKAGYQGGVMQVEINQ
jgi:hypothetical protein